ncbi:MAG: nitrate- and nitrite sensing domain-containing protein [Lautropia sp.]
MYLASRGQRFAAERERCEADSLALEHAVRQRHFGPGVVPEQVYGGMRLLSCIARFLHALDGLPALRLQVIRREIAVDEATRGYSELIAGMLSVVWEAADTAMDPTVSRALVALFNLMRGKELAGQERAAGTVALAAGRFDGPAQQRLSQLYEAQQRCLQTFADFADPMLLRLWQNQQATADEAALQRWRAEFRATGAERAAPRAAERWFEASTRRIDALRLIEDAATSAVVACCEAALAAARTGLDDEAAALQALAAPAAVDAADTAAGAPLANATMALLHAQTRRLQSMAEDLAAAQAALRERKLVERAKGLLMQQRGLCEEEAYRLLRNTAMQQHRRLGEVAEHVLQGAPPVEQK